MNAFYHFVLILLSILTVCQSGDAVGADPPSFEDNNYFVFSPDGDILVKVSHAGNATWVRIHETKEMKTVSQWQIPDFKAHTIHFSLRDRSRLLLADKNRLFVYRLEGEKQSLQFFQPKIKGREIVQAYFDAETDEIVWATRGVIYKTDTTEKKQQEILSVPWNEGEIKSVTSLGDNELAVHLEGSANILLLSPDRNYVPVELTGHQKPVVGLQGVENKQLISLDEGYELIHWNTAAMQPVKKLKLEKPTEDSKLLGVTLDDAHKNLHILSGTDSGYVGQRYAISDLKKGKADPETMPMTVTTAGNVYPSLRSVAEPRSILEDSLRVDSRGKNQPIDRKPQPLPKKKNTLYDLAAIEAENGNYQAALDLIKKIPLDDPEYGLSRKLKREVFDAIHIENSLMAARDQIKRGNYKSATVILNDALAINPESRAVKQQLRHIEEKTRDDSWIKWLLIGGLLLLLVLLGYLLWRYQSQMLRSLKGKQGGSRKPFGWGKAKKPRQKEKQDLRRAFIYKLDETRKLVNKAARKDVDRRYKNTWMEYTARLNTIEKRARLNDKYLENFIEELEKVQEAIARLDAQSEKKTAYQFHEDPQSTSTDDQDQQDQQDQQDKARASDSAKAEPEEPKVKPPDHYAVLGVRQNATLEEVKRAYRLKMKEYHPDRHNSSDFKWVKEEADKRTRQIQEAYAALSERLK